MCKKRIDKRKNNQRKIKGKIKKYFAKWQKWSKKDSKNKLNKKRKLKTNIIEHQTKKEKYVWLQKINNNKEKKDRIKQKKLRIKEQKIRIKNKEKVNEKNRIP